MVRVLPVLLLVVIVVYTAVHISQADSEQVRGLPKTLWLVLDLVLPVIGVLGWWIFGRPLGHQPPPLAPDDDPDFLRRL